MHTENILQFIPQRPPFVMLDTLIHADEKNAITNFTITAENILCENYFFSEAGLLENIAQTAAAGAGFRAKQAGKNVETGYIAAVKNFEVFFLPKANNLLTTEAIIKETIFNMTTIKGKVSCDNLTCAQCELKIFIPYS